MAYSFVNNCTIGLRLFHIASPYFCEISFILNAFMNTPRPKKVYFALAINPSSASQTGTLYMSSVSRKISTKKKIKAASSQGWDSAAVILRVQQESPIVLFLRFKTYGL